MSTAREHLAWCVERAMEYANAGTQHIPSHLLYGMEMLRQAELLRDCDACAAERDHARAVIEEVRKALQASTLFFGDPVEDVVTATDLLATAYEAERSRL